MLVSNSADDPLLDSLNVEAGSQAILVMGYPCIVSAKTVKSDGGIEYGSEYPSSSKESINSLSSLRPTMEILLR